MKNKILTIFNKSFSIFSKIIKSIKQPLLKKNHQTDSKRFQFGDFLEFKKDPDFSNVYNVEIKNLDILDQYNSLECHIVMYPYSRKINSNNISFFPFEEYVKDIQSHQRSAYVKLGNPLNNIFGLFLGLVITGFFIWFKPDDLYSIESIVSVFGAYIIGKELWDDIERILINISKRWRVQYRENYYIYQLEKNTTLTYYSSLAKKERYGKASLLPEKIDYIEKSNSKTIRMYFNMTDLKTIQSQAANVLFIQIDSDVLHALEADGFMFGVKLSFNKDFLCFTRCFELFQSINNQLIGCLDEKGNWHDDTIFYRKTSLWGRIKFFWNKGFIHDKYIINQNLVS